MITRLAPIPENDSNKYRDELKRMLTYIDPTIILAGGESTQDISEMAKWYQDTFGTPGTPEFDANIKRINEQLNKDV